MKKINLLLLIVLWLGLAGCSPSAKVDVKNLQVEMKENPLGIDVSLPRFSWQIHSGIPDLQQVSYQIQVAETEEGLKSEKDLIWDSGTILSDQSILIPYAGKALAPEKPYFWRVKVATNQGEVPWSKMNKWSMGLLDASGWKGQWIGQTTLANPGETEQGNTRLAARYLRKEFTADKPVERAMLYISGLGSFDAYLNGKRISDDVFSSMPSLYPKRIYYNVYDVTDFLLSDKNAIGVVLGNGRFFSMRNPGMKHFGLPRLMAQLKIEYKDGTDMLVSTDTSWKITSKGPIVANNEFDGEEYDARLELNGWEKSGYDESVWQAAEVMEAPGGVMTAQPNPNLQIQDHVKAVSVTARPDGKYIIDMGQNMVGWVSVKLKGRKDQPITMRFAESLQKDGSLYMDNLRTAKVTDIYTPAKDGEFSWQPRLVYHGFRFVEIAGLDYEPEPAAFTGDVIYDRMATTGTFETSDAMINQVHQNAFWGIRGNYRGMPTDCPQRDERLGWLGDRATGAYGEAFVLDNALLYEKWMQDIEDAQSPAGSISDVSPDYWNIYNDDVTWPSAFFYVADMLYRHYGDDSAIRKHYPAMKRWMKHMQEIGMQDNIMVRDTYGDWCMPPESQELIHSKDPARKTEGAILSTTVYYDLLNKMIAYARICGRKADIPAYEALAVRMKDAYNAKYFNPATAQYGNNTVTANMLSLRLGLVPDGYKEKVFANIVKKTEEDFGGHVSTGVLGIQHLMRGLTEYGRVDMAYKIVTNDTYPSWGYMIKNGATTIWELWNGDTADPAMNSANHVMLLGDLLIWYYEDLAGIKCAPGALGFKHLLMAPVFPDGLDHVDASYQSVYGDIRSAWTKKDGRFGWQITLPGNTSATVRIPKSFGVKVTEVPGIRSVTEKDDCLEVEIGSGTYRFGK